MLARLAKTRTFAGGCGAISIRRARNTTAASVPFWTTPWTIFITGWWKFSPRAIRWLSESIRIPHQYSGIRIIDMKFNGRSACLAAILLVVCPVAVARPRVERAPSGEAAEKQLEKFSRALKQDDSSRAYAQLSAFAERKSSGDLGKRAALALCYYDYTKERYAQAAKWLERAKGDPLLADYAFYWSAENSLAMGNNADALGGFQEFRKMYPDSVMTEQALQSLGAAALAANQPASAVAALDAYAHTSERPALLFLRGEAHEAAGQPLDAAAD